MSYQHRDDGFSKFVSGLFFGLIGGTALGMLYATKPGKDLRKDIEINSEEAMISLKERLEELKEKANDQLKDFKGFTDDKFRASAMNIQDKVQDLGKQLEELTQSRVDSLADKKRELRN